MAFLELQKGRGREGRPDGRLGTRRDTALRRIGLAGREDFQWILLWSGEHAFFKSIAGSAFVNFLGFSASSEWCLGAQDDSDEFQVQPDWHAPGLAEDRISELFLPMTEGMGIVPTFISLHSGCACRLRSFRFWPARSVCLRLI